MHSAIVGLICVVVVVFVRFEVISGKKFPNIYLRFSISVSYHEFDGIEYLKPSTK